MSDILNDIRRLLWLEWDPIGISQSSEEPDDEYDTYAKGVCRLLREGRDHHAIAQYLERSALHDIGVERSLNHAEVAAQAIALIGAGQCDAKLPLTGGDGTAIFRSDLASAMLADLLHNQDEWWDSELHTITGYSRAEYVALTSRILEQGEPTDPQDRAMLRMAANNLLGYPGICQRQVAAVGGVSWPQDVAQFLKMAG